MSSTLPTIDVTGRDFIALEDMLTKRAVIKFPNLPQTDFNKSGFMAVMVDLLAGVGDGLHFYLDNIAQELFWGSVRDRSNAIRLGENTGFKFKSSKASRVVLKLSIDQVSEGDVIFPIRTQALTNDPISPVVFELLEEAIIPAGQLSVLATAENAELKTEFFTSDGQPLQKYQVSNTPYVEGSASIEVSGIEWISVDDFFNSKTTDKHYIDSVDGDDRLSLEFGDNEQGVIPVGEVTVKYKIGGGLSGNVFANTVTQLDRSFTDIYSNSVNVRVVNESAASGGADRETVEEARYRAPRSIKTNERTVADEDFDINATDVNGVSRAKIFTSDNNPDIPENTGFLYIVPIGGGIPSEELKNEVFNHLTKVKPVILGFNLNVVGATFVPISFTIKVYVKDASHKSSVAKALKSSFDAYFSETIISGNSKGQPNPKVDFQKKFFNSEISAVAQDSHSQVRNIDLQTDLEELYKLTPEQFPQKGILVFLDGDTGLPLQ